MTATIVPPTMPAYSEEDHQVWAALCAIQLPLMERHACRLFLDGWPRLELNPRRLPDPAVVSERLRGLSGWTLGDAQNAYLGPTEWFEHIAERRFPVTNYIRKMDQLAFTPLPDLFHEYFGHLPLFADRRFGAIAQAFGPLYMAGDERQRLEIARLWWFTTEFALIREGGELRAFGAGLLSSPGELARAFAPETTRLPFELRRAVEMPSAVYEMHGLYFILDSLEHVYDLIVRYAHEEGLPRP
jgi:phenylalanine-4-hydroxylase